MKERVRRLTEACLQLVGVYEDQPFGPGTLVYRVRAAPGEQGKVFALLMGGSDDGGATRLNLKCEPDLAVRLRAEHPEVVPGYHMNKRHWNTLRFGGDAPSTLTDAEIRDFIEDSYDLVVSSLPRRFQERLHWVGLARGTENSMG